MQNSKFAQNYSKFGLFLNFFRKSGQNDIAYSWRGYVDVYYWNICIHIVDTFNHSVKIFVQALIFVYILANRIILHFESVKKKKIILKMMLVQSKKVQVEIYYH